MQVTPDTSPDALDPQRVLRHNRVLLARRFAMFVGIFGFLAVLPLILMALGVPDSFWTSLPAAPAVIGMVFTVRSFAGRPLRIRKAKKVLSQYPLERYPSARYSKPVRFNQETRFLFEVDEPGSAEPRTLVTIDVQGYGRIPKGAEDGVWIAGDLPFGGVLVIPSTNTLLLMRPENWDENAPKRNGASPDRIERAKNAGIELIPF